ncbi:MAG TPA: hypothetical protein VEL79_04015 [Vicinamibacterales bacterium]|nr:hypothetical protein [Vicinamibacterales bacterium]
MVKKVLLAVMLAIPGIAGAPQYVYADGCTTTLLDCYVAAAKIDSFWYRTAAGLDCELQYAGCVRSVLISA